MLSIAFTWRLTRAIRFQGYIHEIRFEDETGNMGLSVDPFHFSGPVALLDLDLGKEYYTLEELEVLSELLVKTVDFLKNKGGE